MTTYECNICLKQVQINSNPDERPEKKGWEIWKFEVSRKVYELPLELERYEKIILPKLVNKYPSEHQILKTWLSKARDIENQFIKPIQEKHEEILWKFFYKKGKVFPYFNTSEGSYSSRDEMCDSCSSELEVELKPHEVDQIEYERIMRKFEEIGKELEKAKIEDKFSEQENEEIKKEWEKFTEKFLKGKEEELNNKILTERERERERERRFWQASNQLNSMDCRW